MILSPIFLLAVGAGLYMAFNIGANDVANAMGTSVASGALTPRRAVMVAGIFDFLGAVLVGSYVAETIRKGVVNPQLFSSSPEILLYGMVSALLGAALWLTLATRLGLPVSTTHSIVGAVIGFGVVGAGIRAVNWKVVGTIVLSWIISPLAGAGVSFLIFAFIRKKILDTFSPLSSMKKIGPYFIGLVVFILSLSVILEGTKHAKFSLSFPLAFFLALGGGSLGVLVGRWLLRKATPGEGEYKKVENLSKPLQVISASYECFAHGANDVANAIGPVAAIIGILTTQKVGTKVEVPLWVLALGGAGIVAGILLWGYRVMDTIGKKITEITPTRGFSAEFGAATAVLLFSRLGMPVSTTHVSVGTVMGVGLARGIRAINLRVIRYIIISWVLTLPIAGALTGGIFLLFQILIF